MFIEFSVKENEVYVSECEGENNGKKLLLNEYIR